MKKPENSLFDRVVSILEHARTNVVRSVNNNMVLAYWLIGREIVQEIQGGKERAEYGKQVVTALSTQLTQKYGKGFSTTNLWYFRQFYLVFVDRVPQILHKPCGEFNPKLHKPRGVLADMSLAVENCDSIKGFSSQLSWSHYRTLTQVEHKNERLFYEIEAEKVGRLTHQDVGQMDSYVRMFDDIFITEDDNPTIGLILCAEKNETVAKYSVLKDSKHLFASKYMLYLPTEEELQREIDRERRLFGPSRKKLGKPKKPKKS